MPNNFHFFFNWKILNPLHFRWHTQLRAHVYCEGASAGNGRFKTDLHQHHEHKSYAKYKTGKRIPNARNYITGWCVPCGSGGVLRRWGEDAGTRIQKTHIAHDCLRVLRISSGDDGGDGSYACKNTHTHIAASPHRIAPYKGCGWLFIYSFGGLTLAAGLSRGEMRRRRRALPEGVIRDNSARVYW